MKLFKSREERRLERDLEVRRGMQLIRKNIRDLERNEQAYLEKAKRAYRLGSAEQVTFLKSTLRRTLQQRRTLERQLLNIETALQLKSQAEAHAQFARSMNAVSRAISDSFGATDFATTQRDFERALARAESLEQRMEIFLESSTDSLMSAGVSSSDDLPDAELDRWIAGEAQGDESDGEIDQLIQDGLADVERELGRSES